MSKLVSHLSFTKVFVSDLDDVIHCLIVVFWNVSTNIKGIDNVGKSVHGSSSVNKVLLDPLRLVKYWSVRQGNRDWYRDFCLLGKEIEIDIEPTDKVERIKERVEEKEGIPPPQQRLIFSGRFLLKKYKRLMVIFYLSPYQVRYLLGNTVR